MNVIPAAMPLRSWLIAPIVALAAFMEVMDISIANVSLPHIAGDLSSSQDESTWILTSYLVTNAIVMPISGWLSNRFGRKRFFLTCIAGFTLSSFLCGLAPNLATLIVLRALQGATGGGLQPSGQAILNDSFPPDKRGMAAAIYGIATVVAPTVGPTLGGWITDSYDWRWIFLINVPVGLVLLFLVGALIQDPTVQRPASRSVDGLGFAYVALTLGGAQILMDRGQQDDWFASPFIGALAVIAAVGLALLIWRELHHDNPMVDLKLLRNPDFAVAFVLMFMLGFMLLGSTYLIPAYAQSLMGYRSVDAGMVLTPGGMVTVALLPLIGQAVNRVDLRLLIATGLLITSAGLYWMTRFYLGMSFQDLMLARCFQALGLPFFFVPINAMAFRGLSRDQVNGASALVNLARNFGGSVGISFASTMLVRRTQFHQSRLVEDLQGLNPAYPDYAEQLGRAAGSSATAPDTLARLYEEAVQQASLLSFLETFKILAIAFVALIPLLLLVKAGKGGARRAAH